MDGGIGSNFGTYGSQGTQGDWTRAYSAKGRRPADRGHHTRSPRESNRRRYIIGLSIVVVSTVVAFSAILSDAPRATVGYQASSESCELSAGTLNYTALGFTIEDENYSSYEITLEAVVSTATRGSTSVVVDSKEPGNLEFKIPFDAGGDPECIITVRGITP